ncbi:ATP-binding protein [Saccharospirillum sp. HFRX-1]|uniref:sensor histidine kinase n=1 Tax=unclassified Saccharospirillum TaxID=2633430 RepID=UPI00371F2117
MFEVNAFLARRLLAAITLGVACAILVTILMQSWTLTRTMEGLRDQNVDASLSNMLPLINESIWAFDSANVERAAEALLRDPYISGVAIRSVEGEIDLQLGDLAGQNPDWLQPADSRTERLTETALIIATPVAHEFNGSLTTIGWIYLRSDNELIRNQVGLVLGGALVSAIVAIIALLGALYWVVQHLVARPIRHFSDYVQRISPRDVTQWSQQREPLLEGRNDEIGQLYEVFNRQHDSLVERDRALRRHQDNLEKIVAERTEQLQQSNRSLTDSLDKLKIAQEELLQSEKLASLGNLVSGVAHEVNTPLGISITAASHLTSEARLAQRALQGNELKKSDLERFFNECLETGDLLSANLDRAAQLIRSFKQVAVDQTSEEQRRINLHAYIDEVLASLRPKYKTAPVEIINDIDPDITTRLSPGALAQVVTNLVINSLLHGFDDGQRAGQIRFSNAPAGSNRLALLYEDDGQGMSEETLKHIFDPFYTTRRSSGGSGLGMNIVFNLVTGKLGGRIQIHSPPHDGCRFRITLPLEPAAEAVEDA